MNAYLRNLEQLPPPPPNKTGWPWTEESQPMPPLAPNGKPWPRISIVTPSYNQGQFIEETIRSVLLQNYPNIEYIIIDGSSTDDTIEIIRKYEPWLTYWVSKPDKGQSHAINKGWERSTGDVVAYLNSDDVYMAGTFAEAVGKFRDDPDCAVVHGKTMVTDEEGKELRLFGSSFDLISSVNGCNCTVAQPSAFIRMPHLKEVGFMDMGLHKAMDYDLWLRLALKYSFYYVPTVWSKFRLHVRSKTTQNATNRSDCLKIMKKLYALPNLPPNLLNVKQRAFAWAYLFQALDCSASGRTIQGRFHAIRAFVINAYICIRPGRELFLRAIFGLPVSNLLLSLGNFITTKK